MSFRLLYPRQLACILLLFTGIAQADEKQDSVRSGVAQDAMDRLGEGWALRLVSELPPDQADVVMLRVIGDLSVKDVASILDKQPGAVRALQHRAIRRLAARLGAEAVTP